MSYHGATDTAICNCFLHVNYSKVDKVGLSKLISHMVHVQTYLHADIF